MFGSLILMNNYLHDVATAVLLVSAVMLFAFGSRAARGGLDSGAAEFFVGSYRKLTLLAAGSLVWIILGGVVRTLAYRQYEWLPAAGRGQVAALILKHILIFTALGFGIYYWLRVRALVRTITVRRNENIDEKK